LEEDRHLLLDAGHFLVERVLAIAETRQRMSRAAPSPEQRTERRVAEKSAVKAVVAKLKETVLLDLVMPNGVAMRYCTGEQMSGFGSAYSQIAERVGPALVGKLMIESEVRALLQAAI
jgi:hypothetical protein